MTDPTNPESEHAPTDGGNAHAPHETPTGQPEETVQTPPAQKKKRKRNILLLESFGISAAIQIGLLVLAGGYVVYEAVLREDAQFEEPPPELVEELPEDVEVQIQKQPPRMNLQDRPLRIKSVGNISVANIDANVIAGQGETFSVGAQFSNMGNLDIGSAAGSLGLGLSEVNVFGLKDKGERILFLVDGSRRMVEDRVGGLWSYQAVKDELVKLVGELSPGTLFNVMVFDHLGRTQGFRSEMQASTPQAVDELRKWFDPINKTVEVAGRVRPNIRIQEKTDTPTGAALASLMLGNGPFYVTQLALEQGADLVYVITTAWTGFHPVRRPLNDKEREEWTKVTSDRKYQEQLKAFERELAEKRPAFQRRVKAMNAERAAKGLPPRVWNEIPERQYAIAGVTMKTKHPGREPHVHVDEREVKSHFQSLVDSLYKARRLRPPNFNVIVLMAEDDELSRDQKSELREFTRVFGQGRYMELKGRKAIESSRSK